MWKTWSGWVEMKKLEGWKLGLNRWQRQLEEKIWAWPKFWVIWKIYICSFHTSDSALRISLQRVSQTAQSHKLPFIAPYTEDFTDTSPPVNTCTFTQTPFHWFPQQRNPDSSQHVCMHTHSHRIPPFQSLASQICLDIVPASLSFHPSYLT